MPSNATVIVAPPVSSLMKLKTNKQTQKIEKYCKIKFKMCKSRCKNSYLRYWMQCGVVGIPKTIIINLTPTIQIQQIPMGTSKCTILIIIIMKQKN